MTAIEKRTSQKGAVARKKILQAAVDLFAARGHDGASIRDIEQRAGVNRGLITYHFGTKDDLWKAAIDHAFQPYFDELKSMAGMLRDLDPETRQQRIIGGFIRASAARPFMNQLMIQENYEPSWRSDWIVERFLIPAAQLNRELGGEDPWMNAFESNPHIRYILLGACAMPFSLSLEAKALFGVDVHGQEFIDRHIETVLKMIQAVLLEPHSSPKNHV